jgi:hypothetical protein
MPIYSTPDVRGTRSHDTALRGSTALEDVGILKRDSATNYGLARSLAQLVDFPDS